MGVAVEGDRYGAVAEAFGDDPRALAHSEHEGCCGVTQVVDANSWQLGGGGQLRKSRGEDVAGDWGAAVGGEHPVAVLPVGTVEQLAFELAGAVAAQLGDQVVGDPDAAKSFLGFRRRLHIAATGAAQVGDEGTVNCQDAGVEVDVGPGEAEQLAAAHAGGDCHQPERVEIRGAGGVEEGAGLLGVPRVGAARVHAREGDADCGIARDDSPRERLAQGVAQDGVLGADRAGLEAKRLEVGDRALQLERAEGGELLIAERGLETGVDVVPVLHHGERLERGLDGGKPLVQVLVDGEFAGGDELAAVDGAEQLADRGLERLAGRGAKSPLTPLASRGVWAEVERRFPNDAALGLLFVDAVAGAGHGGAPGLQNRTSVRMMRARNEAVKRGTGGA